jgi:proteasome lid subunit RPN8/RPN11
MVFTLSTFGHVWQLKSEVSMFNDTTRLKTEVKADPEETLITDRASADLSGGVKDLAAEASAAEVKVDGPPPEGGGAQGADAGVPPSGTSAAGGNANGQKPDKPKVVFGELIPEEQVSPFPYARLLHWKPTVKRFDVKEPPFKLVVTSEVLAMVNAHVSTDLKNELGGFLLGNRYVCPNDKIKYIQIDNCPAAKFTSSGPVSIELVNETFQHFVDEKESKYRGKEAIGWYHSHPDKGAFLSPMDKDVHKSRFPSSWTVALVIDPNRKEAGFFCSRDGELHLQAMMDFYELRGIKTPPTVTYMPWANYQCFDGQTDEERVPQLANDIGLHVVAQRPWWRITLPARLKEYRSFLAVGGLAWLASILIWMAGLFGQPKPAEATSNTGTAAATPNVVDEIKASTTSSASAAGSQLPPANPSVYMCKQYPCSLGLRFSKRLEDLQIEIDGQPQDFKWTKDEAIVDIRGIAAVRNMKESRAASTAINVKYWEANNPEQRVPISVQLFKQETPIIINRQPIIIRTPNPPPHPQPPDSPRPQSQDAPANRTGGRGTRGQGQGYNQRRKKRQGWGVIRKVIIGWWLARR